MNYKIKAFTLIELLVVVALIGIIAAIGIKGYQGYIESAQKKSSQTKFY
jgi:prepilin-type N-terminal cleavage/methylation domain-containing protein